ncbi:MAG: GC-type dockerin domain-anchored protein [Phycisphaerales bacterium JB040]
MTRTRPNLAFAASLLAAPVLVSPALAADRDVQFRSIDLASGIVELHNFGDTPVDLSGWRFCTHDFNEIRRYSAVGGLDGVTIPAGGSLFFHYNNDAPADPNAIDIADAGGAFALPLTSASYALEIFTPGPDGTLNFGSTTDMNDHVQWAVDPASVGSASARSVQAAAAGLWTASTAYIDIEPTTSLIVLTDDTGGELHGPANYVLDPGPTCDADVNNDGVLDNGDIGAFVTLFLAADPVADFNDDGILDNGDIGAFVAAFLAGC